MKFAGWVAGNAEAGALASELRRVRMTMADNEAIVSLPETREFHWSKIEREILRDVAAPRRPDVSWLTRWRRWVIPVAGVGALACVTLAVNELRRPTFDEVCATDQGMDAVTFHDQSAGMTVVWLQDSSPAPATAEPAKPSAPADANSDVEME
jgi:hypothetical protein